jgi:DNA-binding MarR family transcriptional regulator
MTGMKPRITETVTFWLGVVGSRVAAGYAEQIESRALKPKHVGLLAILDREGVRSQQELARELRVAPSLVVSLVDHLEERGAVRRGRDPADRRRQNVALTTRGRTLLGECAVLAAAMDARLTAGFDAGQRQVLHALLAQVAANDPS